MDKLLRESRKKIWSCTFLTAIICGLVTHVYAMTNNFLTYDSMWNLYSEQDMLSSGRPFLTYACGISSFYNLPWLNGCLAILFLAISAVVITELFNIKNKVTGMLIAALLVTFPSLTSTFCYIFTVDGYMLAVLLATLSVYVTVRYRWGFAAGIVLLCLSIGIYQAYFSFAIVLCILYLLLVLLEDNELKKVLVHTLRMCLMGIGGYILYVASLKIMLAVKGVDMSGYQGTNKVASLDFSGVISGMGSAYRDFKDFAMYGGILAPNMLMKLVLICIVSITAGLYIYLFLKRRGIKDVLRMVIVIALVAVIPLGTSTISVLSPDTYFHILLRYPWVLLFMFSAVLVDDLYFLYGRGITIRSSEERGNKSKSFFTKQRAVLGVTLLTALLCMLMSFNYAVVGNIVYYGMNERYEKTYAMCLRIASRIEDMGYYHAGVKVAVLGGVPSDNYYPSTDTTTEITKNYFGSQGTLCVSDTAKFSEFWSHYMGMTITTIPLEDEIELTGSEEFTGMGVFPEQDSIQLIGDVLVIKING